MILCSLYKLKTSLCNNSMASPQQHLHRGLARHQCQLETVHQPKVYWLNPASGELHILIWTLLQHGHYVSMIEFFFTLVLLNIEGVFGSGKQNKFRFTGSHANSTSSSISALNKRRRTFCVLRKRSCRLVLTLLR